MKKGGKTRPTRHCGVCRERGGDPESAHFLDEADLGLVSGSPFRVMTARLQAGRSVVQRRIAGRDTREAGRPRKRSGDNSQGVHAMVTGHDTRTSTRAESSWHTRERQTQCAEGVQAGVQGLHSPGAQDGVQECGFVRVSRCARNTVVASPLLDSSPTAQAWTG